jgi:hypothetical protein
MEARFLDEALPLLGGRLPASFERRRVSVAPGTARAYLEADWRGALVLVQKGEIELESVTGERERFRTGNILFLVGLRLRALHNLGKEPALLLAVSRKPKSMFVAMSCSNRSPHGPISFRPAPRSDSQTPTTRTSTT